jgi:uncharacterized protein (DUF4213/DUF364 family)
MAHTCRGPRKAELQGSGDLEGGSALALAQRLLSWEPLEASLGAAALNSLIEAKGEPGNVVDMILGRAPGKAVTVIGRFPFNDQVRAKASEAYFLELEPQKGELPASASEWTIPRSDIAVITATALINHTLQRLLELGRNASCLTIVLGPTTPMSPILFDFGADILAGVRVSDPEALFRRIVQGTKAFKRLAGAEPVCLAR